MKRMRIQKPTAFCFVLSFMLILFAWLGLAWANDVFTQFFLCDNKTITLSLTAHTQTHKHIKCNKSEFTWTTPDTQDNNTKNDDEKSHPNWIKTDDDGDGARCFLYALSRCSSHAFFWYLNKVHIEAIKKIHFYSCQEELVLMGKKAMGMKSTLLPMSFAQVANMLLLLSTLLTAFFGRTIERIIRLSNCLPGEDKIERE